MDIKSKVYFKIVIPLFNCEKYLSQCLDSILSQEFEDYFVIIVDDKSTDKSYEIAKTYEQQHPDKIVAIQAEEKSYQGICRNIGLEYQVDSEYVWFIDADDYILPFNSLARLYTLTCRYPSTDMIAFSYMRLNGNQLSYWVSPDIMNAMKTGTAATYCDCAPWARIYKSATLDIRFEQCIYEDLVFFLKYLDSGHSFVQLTSEPFYVYRTNPNGDTQSVLHKDISAATKHRLDEFYKKMNELAASAKSPIIRQNVINRCRRDGQYLKS